MPKPLRISIRVPFAEAIEAARSRGVELSEAFYSDLPAQVRARAFAVSGLAALDQTQAVLDNLMAATETGQTFRDWKKATLRDVPAVAALPKGRLETIYRNAIQSHYAVGRFEQQTRNASRRPVLKYAAINDGRTRPAHRAMNGVIAPVDDPVWKTRYPPWGHNCRCSVISLTEKQAVARGWAGAVGPVPPKGAGDWDHSPVTGADEGLKQAIEARRRACIPSLFASGRGDKVWCDARGAAVLKTLATAVDDSRPMPPPRRDPSLFELPSGQGEKFYLERFMAQFGASWDDTAIVKDRTGLFDLAVSGVMFEDHKTGRSKILKRERAPWLLYVAKTVLDPDEIRLHQGGHGDRTLYLLSRFEVRRGMLNTLAVFKEDGKVWTGWSGFPSWKEAYLDEKRNESVRIYMRRAD